MLNAIYMGVGRIISRGEPRDFSIIFPGGARSGGICFFSLKTKKTIFFLIIFSKSRGAKAPPASPSNAHGCVYFWIRYICIGSAPASNRYHGRTGKTRFPSPLSILGTYGAVKIVSENFLPVD